MEKEKEIAHSPQLNESTRTPLHDQFDSAKPIYPDSQSAIEALGFKLEQLAASVGKSRETLLLEAHTASHYQPQHRTALNLERQINLLKS
ncbi:hypothetical protein WDW86_03590 [Bdellovibrionota bacterium FG-2]